MNWGAIGGIAGLVGVLIAIGILIYTLIWKLAQFTTREELGEVKESFNEELKKVNSTLTQLTTQMRDVYGFYKATMSTLWSQFLESMMSEVESDEVSTNPQSKIEEFCRKGKGERIKKILSADISFEEKVIKVINEIGLEKIKLLTDEEDTGRAVGKIALFIKNFSSS